MHAFQFSHRIPPQHMYNFLGLATRSLNIERRGGLSCIPVYSLHWSVPVPEFSLAIQHRPSSHSEPNHECSCRYISYRNLTLRPSQSEASPRSTKPAMTQNEDLMPSTRAARGSAPLASDLFSTDVLTNVEMASPMGYPSRHEVWNIALATDPSSLPVS